MDEATKDALEGSIRQWEKKLKHSFGEVQLSTASCELCQRFHSNGTKKVEPFISCCLGCPVAERTGQVGCHGTPYELISELNRTYENESVTIDTAQSHFEALAAEEITFLKSLLENDQ